MIYPKIKKYQSPAGPITTDSYGIKGDPSKMSTLGDKPQANPMAVVQGIGTAGTLALSAYQSKNPVKVNDLGIGSENTNVATLQGGLKGMNAGMSLGSVAGPQGAAIGAAAGLVIGGVAGYVNNQKEKVSNRKLTSSIRKDQRTYLDQGFKQDTSVVNEEAKRQRSLIPSNYRMFSAKRGGMFPKFQGGGTYPSVNNPTIYTPTDNLTKYRVYPETPNKEYTTPKFTPTTISTFGSQAVAQKPRSTYNFYNYNYPSFNLSEQEGTYMGAKTYLEDYYQPDNSFGIFGKIANAISSLFTKNNSGNTSKTYSPPTRNVQQVNTGYNTRTLYNRPKMIFKQGGVTPHAVIPSGPLHSEKNNLGTKGLPVVHTETNEKKAEVEREEIIFTKPQTDFIMKYHNELKTNPTDQDYEEFGKLVGIFIDGAKDMNDE